jgi:hypothetical protein
MPTSPRDSVADVLIDGGTPYRLAIRTTDRHRRATASGGHPACSVPRQHQPIIDSSAHAAEDLHPAGSPQVAYEDDAEGSGA